MGFPSGSAVKILPTMQETYLNMCSILVLGRFPEGEHGNLFQYSCLENPLDRGAWQAIVNRVVESDMTEATEHSIAQHL